MTVFVHALIEKGDLVLLVEDGIDVSVPHGPVGPEQTPEEALVKIIRDGVGLRAIPYRLVVTEVVDDREHAFWRCTYMGGLPEARQGVAGWYSRQEAATVMIARHPRLREYFSP